MSHGQQDAERSREQISGRPLLFIKQKLKCYVPKKNESEVFLGEGWRAVHCTGQVPPVWKTTKRWNVDSPQLTESIVHGLVEGVETHAHDGPCSGAEKRPQNQDSKSEAPLWGFTLAVVILGCKNGPKIGPTESSKSRCSCQRICHRLTNHASLQIAVCCWQY